MKHFFILRKMDRLAEKKWKLSLEIASHNQKGFGCKILQFSGSKTWNSLPYNIKSAKNLAPFETMIKFWNGETCNCNWKSLFKNSGLSKDSSLCWSGAEISCQGNSEIVVKIWKRQTFKIIQHKTVYKNLLFTNF